MSWTKAVWLEDNEEVEGVVPTVWVDETENMLWWPKKMLHFVRSYKKQEVPESDWKVFKLIKLKLSDGKFTLYYFISKSAWFFTFDYVVL